MWCFFPPKCSLTALSFESNDHLVTGLSRFNEIMVMGGGGGGSDREISDFPSDWVAEPAQS